MKKKGFTGMPALALTFALFAFGCTGTVSPSVTSASSGESLPSIRIKNSTGHTVYYVYVSPVSSDSWGSDWLGDDVLEDGNLVSLTLRSPLSVEDTYDIRLRDSDGDTYTRRNVPIHSGSLMEFTIGDLDVENIITNPNQGNQDMPAIRIVNNTGYTVYYINISEVTSDSWGPDRLDERQVLQSGSAFLYHLPYPLDVMNRYDIRLEDSDGDTYTKRNILVKPNFRIVFTISDLDG
jgi:hypothetical protein